MNYKILIVDDEKNIRDGLQSFLVDESYETETAQNGKEAMMLLKETEIDLVITDMRMSPISGDQLLQHIVSRYPSIPVIILTGHGSVEGAVECIHSGAYDYLSKPVDLDRLLLLVKRALQARELYLQNRRIREELDHAHDGTQLVARSMSMQKVVEKINLAAPSSSSILITGESGVGKEVCCNYIHNLSTRRNNPLISVHCAALSESLLESELFGHEKGAFTGAIALKKGRFELANGGTIFLDEIGEIDANIQVKLLRVLQEQRFERVGGETSIQVDVRVITATNKDLKKEVQAGRFREDLYYRLSVVNFEIPPLRERKEDILVLATSFLKQLAEVNNKKHIVGFTKEAMHLVSNYHWPGNIRQLKNCIENAVVMSQSKYVGVDDFPEEIVLEDHSEQKITLPLDMSLRDYEKSIIQSMLSRYKGNKSKVAEVLAIGRKTLHNKLKEYNINEYTKEDSI